MAPGSQTTIQLAGRLKCKQQCLAPKRPNSHQKQTVSAQQGRRNVASWTAAVQPVVSSLVGCFLDQQQLQWLLMRPCRMPTVNTALRGKAGRIFLILLLLWCTVLA